jgi:hypothetical protein
MAAKAQGRFFMTDFRGRFSRLTFEAVSKFRPKNYSTNRGRGSAEMRVRL